MRVDIMTVQVKAGREMLATFMLGHGNCWYCASLVRKFIEACLDEYSSNVSIMVTIEYYGDMPKYIKVIR